MTKINQEKSARRDSNDVSSCMCLRSLHDQESAVMIIRYVFAIVSFDSRLTRLKTSSFAN